MARFAGSSVVGQHSKVGRRRYHEREALVGLTAKGDLAAPQRLQFDHPVSRP